MQRFLLKEFVLLQRRQQGTALCFVSVRESSKKRLRIIVSLVQRSAQQHFLLQLLPACFSRVVFLLLLLLLLLLWFLLLLRLLLLLLLLPLVQQLGF